MRKMSYSSKSFRVAGLAAAALVLSSSLAVWAAPAAPPAPQPAPAAPSAPAVNPSAPGAPAPTGTEAARARAAAVAAKANIDIGEGWTRATPEGSTAVVYLKITSVKDADKLVAIDLAMAEKADIQDQTIAGAKPAVVQMLDIPAGATLDFRPGGRFLALSGLKAPLKEGESFLITLKFDKAGTQSLPVKVLNATATGLPPVGSTRKGDTTAAVSQRTN